MQAKKSNFTPVTQVRPDAKGRVTLSKLASGISSYNVYQDADGRLLLEPVVEIPAQEKWLFENAQALQSVKQGLKEAKAGQTKSLGSFAKYVDEDEA